MPAPIPQSQLGQLVAPGFAYQITPEDLLWLARAVQFEGGDHQATIWAFAQRFAGITRGSSFTTFLRAYSQPINPIWADPNGEKCRANPDMCTPAAIARRERARTIPWGEISAGVRAEVLAFAQAAMPNGTPRATDFASYSVSSWLRRNPTSRILKTEGRSWYATVDRSNGWPADYVRVAYQGRLSAVAGEGFGFWGAALLGGLAAAAIVGVYKASR